MDDVIERCSGLVVLLLMTSGLDGARILGLFPQPVKSHMIVNSALMKELANRGHQVTVFSPYPEVKKISNYTDVEFKVTYPELLQDSGPPNMFNTDKLWKFQIGKMLWDVGLKLCEMLFQEEFIQKLIHSSAKQFDLIIVGAFFNDCVLGLAHKHNIPVVQLCSFGGTKWMDEWVGNPSPYAYVPNVFLNFSDRMNFWQRIVNTLTEVCSKLGRHLYFLPQQDAIVRKYLSNVPSVSELETSISLVLLNHHFSINYPRPLMPNMVQVGGMHVKPPKELPEDLQKYIDESPHGVIYFSMGSNLRSANMPESKAKAFLKAFSKLNQNVLWKWETDSLPGQPKNVKLGKWLPQSDILAHPNVRVFMTHGGLLSTQETLHRGMPIVGIPIYGDQSLNMAICVSAGIGVQLDYTNVTTESVSWALIEVLENPRYRENAQRLSQIYRDQPLTPLQQAVFWTEYVIRHKGAPHMRSAVLDLNWYQYFLLDVIAVLFLAVGSVLLIVFLGIKTIRRRLFGGNKYSKGAQKKRD